MAGRTARLATTQRGWHGSPPEVNPYGDVFSLDAARAHGKAQIDAHAALVAQTGELGADLSVTGEAIEGLHYVLTYLDDPSIFSTLTRELAPYCHQVMGEVARRYKMHVVACFYEAEGDVFYNSAVLFGRDGAVLGRYHKVNLPIYETWRVKNGDSFPVFETDLGPLGMLICYDQMWPEAAACLALGGAKIICHPSAASLTDWQMKTRAMDSQVFYISSTGSGSRVVAPNAAILADCGPQGDNVACGEAKLDTATLSPANYWEYVYTGVRDHRERHLKLRQAEAYRILSDPNPPALTAYPEDNLANTPERIRAVYEQQKEEYQRGLRGEGSRYSWKWSEE
jgi:predicted amidohydrolase